MNACVPNTVKQNVRYIIYNVYSLVTYYVHNIRFYKIIFFFIYIYK